MTPSLTKNVILMTGHEIFRLVAAVVMIGTGVYLLFSFDGWDQLVAALQILIGTIMAVDVLARARRRGRGCRADTQVRSAPAREPGTPGNCEA